MAVSTFDTLRVAKILKGAGFDDDQAAAIVYAIQDALRESVAANPHLGPSDMRTALAEFRSDFYRALWIQGAWLAITFVILMSLMVVLVK